MLHYCSEKRRTHSLGIAVSTALEAHLGREAGLARPSAVEACLQICELVPGSGILYKLTPGMLYFGTRSPTPVVLWEAVVSQKSILGLGLGLGVSRECHRLVQFRLIAGGPLTQWSR